MARVGEQEAQCCKRRAALTPGIRVARNVELRNDSYAAQARVRNKRAQVVGRVREVVMRAPLRRRVRAPRAAHPKQRIRLQKRILADNAGEGGRGAAGEG